MHIIKSNNVPIHVWTEITGVESQALDQLKRVASLPWVFHHVAAMPDVHFGIGCTVGSVIAMHGAITPAAVGVDIGCGMAAVRTNLKSSQLPDSLHKIRLDVEATIPVAFAMHKDFTHAEGYKSLFSRFKDLRAPIGDEESTALKQLGTLGGGNHFIELQIDTENHVWIMLHSGSRGIGNKLAMHHMAIARRMVHNANLPDKDLAVFLAGTPEMEAYRHDLFWAQEYAMCNRDVMLELYKAVLKRHIPIVEFGITVKCHHNYVAEEVHFGEQVLITRKGAIRAGAGEWGIIPGSMGSKSYIVTGRGNADSFESASHGAGRRMSRGDAKRKFTVKDLEEQTRGVECRKDEGIIDEIPGAYKDIDVVMENQKDLVEIKYELVPVLSVKGETHRKKKEKARELEKEARRDRKLNREDEKNG